MVSSDNTEHRPHKAISHIDKAFRHGDIENILETLVKSAGGTAMASHGSGLLGKLASTVISRATGGSKFTKSDIKKVYFVSSESPIPLKYHKKLNDVHRAIGSEIILRCVPWQSIPIELTRVFGHKAMDIAGLSKLSADTLVLVVSVLGFMVSLLCLIGEDSSSVSRCYLDLWIRFSRI